MKITGISVDPVLVFQLFRFFDATNKKKKMKSSTNDDNYEFN